MLFIIKHWRDSPGGLVVKTALWMQGATRLIPGHVTKIVHAACHDLKPKKQQKKLEKLDKLWYFAVIKKRIILGLLITWKLLWNNIKGKKPI